MGEYSIELNVPHGILVCLLLIALAGEARKCFCSKNPDNASVNISEAYEMLGHHLNAMDRQRSAQFRPLGLRLHKIASNKKFDKLKALDHTKAETIMLSSQGDASSDNDAARGDFRDDPCFSTSLGLPRPAVTAWKILLE